MLIPRANWTALDTDQIQNQLNLRCRLIESMAGGLYREMLIDEVEDLVCLVRGRAPRRPPLPDAILPWPND